jgi:leucyl aminopeptidase
MKATNELMILYREENAAKNIYKNSCKKLSKSAKYLIRQELKEAFEDYEVSQGFTHPHGIVHFPNGSSISFLMIEKGDGAFEMGEGVREVFTETFLKSEVVSFNVLGLSKRHQEMAISILSCFQVTSKWKCDEFKAKTKTIKPLKVESGYYTDIPSEKLKAISEYGKVLGEGNNLCRRLCYLPTNKLDCHEYKNFLTSLHSKELGKLGVELEIIPYNELLKMGAGLFCAVAQADLDESAFVAKLKYKPKNKGKTPLKKISLIGKGVVFDSGGLNIKGEDMDGMWRDMTGSAVALGSFTSMVKRRVKCDLECYLPIVENKVSHKAYRQGDVVKGLNGSHVEVTNTDAEGRMAVADCIALAKKRNPDLIIDYCTLTGTAIDALGGKMSAIFSNNKVVAKTFVEAGEQSGERVWDFPILKNIKRDIRRNTIADLKQEVDGEDCDHIVGAAFLDHFYEKTKFVHVDLAAEISSGGLGVISSDVTGFGVFLTNKAIDNFIKLA